MDLLMSPIIDDDEIGAYRRLIVGLIVTAPEIMDERVAMLTEAKFPFVVHRHIVIFWLDLIAHSTS